MVSQHEAFVYLYDWLGMKEARARDFAEDWVARLQGALIMQAANGNTGSFERVLKALSNLAKDVSEQRA